MKTESLVIGEHEYTCGQLPARKGLRVASRLANALSAGVKALPEEGFEMDTAQMVSFLAPILQDPNLGDTLDYLCATFAEGTTYRHVSQDAGGRNLLAAFDVHFADRYDEMLLWLVFALRVSMSSFFRGVRGLGAQAVAGVRSASKSPVSAQTTGLAGA